MMLRPLSPKVRQYRGSVRDSHGRPDNGKAVRVSWDVCRRKCTAGSWQEKSDRAGPGQRTMKPGHDKPTGREARLIGVAEMCILQI